MQSCVFVNRDRWALHSFQAIVAQQWQLKLRHVPALECFIKHSIQRRVVVVDDACAWDLPHLNDSPLRELVHHGVGDLVDVVIAQEWNQVSIDRLDVGLVCRFALVGFLSVFHATDGKCCDCFESLADDRQIVLFSKPCVGHKRNCFALCLSQVFALCCRALPLAVSLIANLPVRRQRSLKKSCLAFEDVNCTVAFLWRMSIQNLSI